MRDILFRGKCVDGSGWVYGYYTKGVAGRWPLRDFIVPKEDAENGYRHDEEVDPATIGQYTGLKDKNGKMIFEGDLVRYTNIYDVTAYAAVCFGEYDQDGSDGEYNPERCIGWYASVVGFDKADWQDEEDGFFPDYEREQSLCQVNQTCEVLPQEDFPF